ncbi:phenylalanine--tRNA ligase subunit beta, partial [Candidatus Aenigmatarchaeota archaeon]
PGLLEFLSKNKHVEYAQKVFEIGDVINLASSEETGTRDDKKLSIALTDNSVGYEDIASVLDSIMRGAGIVYSMKKLDHPSFIKGRSAGVFVKGRQVGFIGEVNPLVLEKWELEKPVAAAMF